jgi:hypothetical protein
MNFKYGLVDISVPRISSEKIESLIVKEDYYRFPNTTRTICCLTLQNGFTISGDSATGDLINFDEKEGEKIARKTAKDKIWALEIYLARQRIYEDALKL